MPASGLELKGLAENRSSCRQTQKPLPRSRGQPAVSAEETLSQGVPGHLAQTSGPEAGAGLSVLREHQTGPASEGQGAGRLFLETQGPLAPFGLFPSRRAQAIGPKTSIRRL